jgi:hypothetical protein
VARGGPNKGELTKDQRIQQEYERMKELFAAMPENELSFCDPLLQNAAFMKVTLEDLQQAINENGVTDQYQNGANQSGTKASADLQAYNSLAKVYNALMDKLSGKLPKIMKQSRLAAMKNE